MILALIIPYLIIGLHLASITEKKCLCLDTILAYNSYNKSYKRINYNMHKIVINNYYKELNLIYKFI